MTRTLCSALGLYSWDGPTDWEMCCVCRCCCSMQEVRIWRGESYLYCDIDTVLLYNSTDAGHNTSAGCHTNLLCPQVGISMIKLCTFTGAFWSTSASLDNSSLSKKKTFFILDVMSRTFHQRLLFLIFLIFCYSTQF